MPREDQFWDDIQFLGVLLSVPTKVKKMAKHLIFCSFLAKISLIMDNQLLMHELVTLRKVEKRLVPS